MKLTFVTGKGGVGKSAVTAAMATALASLKLKVAAIELGENRMHDFGLKSPISILNLKAPDCFEEYVGRHLPKHLGLLLKNRWIQHFINATPGLNEILLLGKITSMATEGPWDVLLVDAPATGHTLSLYEAPNVAFDTLKEGSLKTTIGNILETLQDHQKSGFMLVTQLEDFIVEETIELYRHLKTKLHFHPQGIIINQTTEKISFTNIPKEYPTIAEPLVELLKQTHEKNRQEKKFYETLKEKIPLDYGILFKEKTTDEPTLAKRMAEQLRPWILKNYWNKKN